jgi:hypothetical protein
MDGYIKLIALAKYSSDRKLLSKAELMQDGPMKELYNSGIGHVFSLKGMLVMVSLSDLACGPE